MVVVVVDVVVVVSSGPFGMKPAGVGAGGGGQVTPTDALAALFSVSGSGVSAVTAASSFVTMPHVVVAFDVTVTEKLASASSWPMSQRNVCAPPSPVSIVQLGASSVTSSVTSSLTASASTASVLTSGDSLSTAVVDELVVDDAVGRLVGQRST